MTLNDFECLDFGRKGQGGGLERFRRSLWPQALRSQVREVRPALQQTGNKLPGQASAT